MGAPEETSQALTKIESTVNCKLIEESQTDQYKECSVFKDLRDGSKQKFVAPMVYYLGI